MNKSYKLPLYLGTAFVIFFVFLALFGPAIAPYEVTDQVKTGMRVIDGKNVFLSPPLPPSKEHWLGTDKWGYDLLTLLLYGARYTIFISITVALIRMLLGTLIGVYMGSSEKKQEWWVNFENAWSYIPMIIPVFFFLWGVSVNSSLSSAALIALFIGISSLVGAPSVATSIRKNTEEIVKETYVMAAISIGAGKNRLIFTHILPHLKEHLMIITVTEIMAVMTLMGHLGIFDLFIGGTIMTFDPIIYKSVTHEWAGLVGQYREYVYSYKWILIAPLTFFVLTVLSFYLVAQGLNRKFQVNYNRTPYF